MTVTGWSKRVVSSVAMGLWLEVMVFGLGLTTFLGWNYLQHGRTGAANFLPFILPTVIFLGTWLACWPILFVGNLGSA